MPRGRARGERGWLWRAPRSVLPGSLKDLVTAARSVRHSPIQVSQVQVRSRERPQSEQRNRDERPDVIGDGVRDRATRLHAVQGEGRPGDGLEGPEETGRGWDRHAEADETLEQKRGGPGDVDVEGEKAKRERRGVR